MLLDAVCDPGSGGSRSSCKIPVAVQSLRCLAVSPLSGECLHRAAHQSNLVSCRYCPCCLHPLVERRPLQLNFRGYLPDSSSIDSPRNLSSSRSTCCQTWIRAVDYPYPEGFAPSRWRTLSRFPPDVIVFCRLNYLPTPFLNTRVKETLTFLLHSPEHRLDLWPSLHHASTGCSFIARFS